MTVTVAAASVIELLVTCDVTGQESVWRASVRAASGDVTAAAWAGVNWRRAAELVPLPKFTVADVGQMSRIAVAVGALMVTVEPNPAYIMMLSARMAVTVTVVPTLQATCT